MRVAEGTVAKTAVAPIAAQWARLCSALVSGVTSRQPPWARTRRTVT
nr:hypothetical protein [Acidipropionibacterium jensenii]